MGNQKTETQTKHDAAANILLHLVVCGFIGIVAIILYPVVRSYLAYPHW